MKGLYGCLIIFFSFIASTSLAQSTGDYRSRQTGNWNAATTWQVFNAGAWHNLEDAGAGSYQNITPTSASGVVTIRGSHVVTTTANVTVDQVAILATAEMVVNNLVTVTLGSGSGDDINVNSGGLLTVNGTIQLVSGLGGTNNRLRVFGTVNNLGTFANSTATKMIFEAGSNYYHLFDGTTTNTVPAASFNATSTVNFTGFGPGGAIAPTGLGQTFGNFVWNTPNMDQFIDLAGAPSSVNGNFQIEDTGGGGFYWNQGGGTNNTLTVGGNLIFNGGVVGFIGQTSGPGTMTIAGDMILNGGFFQIAEDVDATIEVAGDLTVVGGQLEFSAVSASSSIDIEGDYTFTSGDLFLSAGAGAINFVGTTGAEQIVTSALIPTGNINYRVGSLAILRLPASQFLGGGGTFLLDGTLELGSISPAGALQTGTSGGNIRVPTANRTYSSGSTIVYNGQSAQFIGNGFPSSGGDVNLTIRNSSGVTLSTNLSIVALRTLLLEEGNLSIGTQTLTINGTVSGNGGIIGGPDSKMVIGGTGNFGTLTFAGTNQLLDFTINRTSSGLVTLGGNLQILGTLTQTAGDIDIADNTFTISGNFSRTSGDFLVQAGSTLSVDGSGTLPSEVGLSGTTLGTLTINRASSTFSTNATLDITNLNLTSGTFNNGTGIGITNDGTITRRSAGSMVNSPKNTTVPYNVVYNVGSAITTGPELPGSSTALNDLTKQGSSSITLAKAITVNGDLTLSSGSFNASTFALTLKGDLISNAAGNFQSSALTFGGTSFIRGTTPPQFNNFTVNASSSLNLGSGTTVNVSGNITNNGSIFGSTSTVIFNGTTVLDGGGTSVLKGDFHHIQIASTGSFAIACSSCTYPSNRYRIDVSGDITVLTGGTFTENQSIVRLVGTGAQSLSMDGENFFDLQVSGSGVVTLSEPLLVSEDLTVATGASLNTGAGNQTITMGDDLIVNGTLTPNQGTVVFNGSGGQTISGSASSINFYNVNISKPTSTTFAFSNPVNIQNSIDIDQPSGAYSVDFGGSVSSPNVTLLSDASSGRTGHILAIPDGVTIAGNVRINRFMEPAPSQANIYRYISSPINGNPASQFQDDFPLTGPFTGANTCAAFRPGVRNMYYYNEAVSGTSENGYVGFPSSNVSEAVVSGRGYAVQMCDGASIITWDVSGSIRRAFSGTPVSLPVTYNNYGLPNDDGLNLVGNPFPAPLDWEAAGWVKTNVTNTFWIRNNKETNIASYNGDLNTGTNGATQYIALGQAFWVQATGASPVLSITEAVKADQQPEFFRKAPLQDLLRMVVSHEGASDEIILHFDERADEASNSFGDSRKFMDAFMNLYSFASDSVRLAINSLNTLTCSSAIGIGLDNVKAGTYSFSFNGFDSFSDVTVTLVDNWKGLSRALKPQEVYTFDITEDQNSFGDSRFQLIFTKGEGIRAVQAEASQVCEGEKSSMQIVDPQEGVSYYAVNSSGGIVSSTVLARSSSALQLDLNLSAGDHKITLVALKEGCSVIPVATLQSVQVMSKPSITDVKSAVICGSGEALLEVSGSGETNHFNWYEAESDVQAIAVTGTGTWTSPRLAASRQYFVSASNMLGCEGPRVPVNVDVKQPEKVSITLVDGSLVTNATGDIKWFLNGIEVGDQSKQLVLHESGEYSLQSSTAGCSSNAFIVVNPEHLSEGKRIIVSPNPATEFVDVEIYSAATRVSVTMVTTTGQLVTAFDLARSGSQLFTGRIVLKDNQAGLYILRIAEDNQITYKRIIRK